jgi:hypothetical protein
MWILKGIFVGGAFFLLFTFLYIRRILGPIPKHGTAVGVDIRSFTAGPSYWFLLNTWSSFFQTLVAESGFDSTN